jgi:GTP diphosphokinase / guanosine-3',5'-bis(diphosphate) 3'-diphosphatase
MHSPTELLSLMKSPSQKSKDLITKAFNFAEKAHAGQTRYSGEPYFNHVFETAKILAGLGLGRRTISAGLLHDVLEDAGVTEEELVKEFGKEIVFLVQGVTKLGKIRYKGVERETESLRKFFVAMSQDLRVLIIKLADRLHNMRTLEHVPEEKRRRIALETFEIYIPLAYRLGIRHIKREMEDLAFQHIYPKEYEEIKQLLKQKRMDKLKHLTKFQNSLRKALAKDGVINISTDVRLKSLYSVYTKLIQKEKDIDKIYDISALRVNVDTVGDCYKVLGIIHGLWRPLPGRIKDYIAFPKPNGYQSLHTTIFTGDGGIVEVQIRTHRMHERAEFGIASHISYKTKAPKTSDTPDYYWFKQFFPQKTASTSRSEESRYRLIPDWVRQLVDAQSYISIPNEFIGNLKSDFFEHRMFIFTPQGEVVDLPIGSSPIDFAYALNAEIGNHFFAAKVNGKLVPIDFKLKNGDIVEILTKVSSQPNQNWLEASKTTVAKRHIKTALEAQGITLQNIE